MCCSNIMRNVPILLGHRGSPHRAPENTMESFRMALVAGAAGFESDVRRSSAGRLGVIHDPKTGRRPGKNRQRVSRSTAAALGLPLLEDVLREFHGGWLD